jgi:membrane protein
MAATDVKTALAEQRQAKQQASWFGILKTSGSEWMDADAMTWAAAIACYTVLALAPLLVVAVKVGAIFLRGQAGAISAIQKNAGTWLGTSAASDAIAAILDKIIHQQSGWVATIISSVLVVVSVGGVFAEIQQAMNRVWKVKPKPGGALSAFIRARLKSVVVLAIAALVVLASVAAAGWITHLGGSSGTGWAIFNLVVELIATLVAMTIIFILVFKTVPDAEIGWRVTVLGAIFTAVLFAAGKYGLTLYFHYAAPTSAFGAVGSLAAVLIWIYYSAQIVLFGAVLTQVYSKQRGQGVRPSAHAQFLKECDETETAAPSPEDPQNKPTRPASGGGGRRFAATAADPGYAAVLGRYAPPAAGQPQFLVDPEAAQEQAVVRNLVVAGAGLAFGALLGGYGALRARRPMIVPVRKPARSALQRRMDRIERKVAHASRVKHFLEREDANERLDEIREKIRQSRKSAKNESGRVMRIRPNPLRARIADAVKSFL